MLMFLSLLACQSCQENQLVQNDKIQNDTGLEDAGFTNDWGSWLAMEILSDGTPVIGYYDKTEGGLGVAKLLVAGLRFCNRGFKILSLMVLKELF